MGVKIIAHTPKRAFSSKPILDAVRKEMIVIGADIKIDFQATTATWKTKVKFTKRTAKTTAAGIIVRVTTENEIYTFVNNGTKPHIIKPKKPGGMLAFPGGGYSAKTVPGVIGSVGGGSSGATVFSKGVKHPGTKGRFFDEAIAQKWQPLFSRRMERAIDRGVAKTGYKI